MRGNAWTITAVISIILTVILIVVVVLLLRDYQSRVDAEAQAREAASEAARRSATLEREVEELKRMIGGEPAAPIALDVLRNQYTERMEHALPNMDPAVQTYHNALDTLIGDIQQEKEGHRVTSASLTQLQSDFDAARTRHEAVVAQERANVARVERERDDDRAQIAREKAEHAQRSQEAISRQNATLARLEAEEARLRSHVTQLEHANMDIRESNEYLTELLDEVRNPNVEYPAGRIISVDQKLGTAIVNVGSADGLRVRTMFSVYHSGITGLSFRTAPVGREPVYCDVCMREVARDVSKASVEVMQILGPHQAEVRILDDILTDPIMVGDVIYSPIWKPGQRMRFALTAGMHLPGSGLDSGMEAVKRLIELNGGVVDCWIDETAADGEDYLQGSLSDLTNFIVINEAASRSADPEVARIHQALVESARNRAIRAISLEELLNRMAWKNMTPVEVFGSLDYSPDMRVTPHHQGALRQSPGVVAPMFTPDNPESRLTAREATPVRTSPGTVTPFFDSNAPPPPSSSGRTSDMFRPRSPN